MTNHVWLVHYKCYSTNKITAELTRPESSEGNFAFSSSKKGYALHDETIAEIAEMCPNLPYRVICSMTDLGEEEE